jgi:hypothetical protein
VSEGFSIDGSQIGALAASFAEVGNLSRRNLRAAITVTARNVKDAWNEQLYSSGHADRTRGSIDYDVTALEGVGATVYSAEIGARRGISRQAGVVLLLEYGSVHNPPHGYGAGALHRNEADFERGLSLALQAAEQAAHL